MTAPTRDRRRAAQARVRADLSDGPAAVRRSVPLLLLPLALIACGLANSPWLRAFPFGVIGIPLYGAALLSVIAPVIVFGIGVRRLWLSALIDIVLFVFYELLVTLRAPGGFGDLYDGLVHGPAQILSFALPLVSPRSLLVAPIALCWLGGAIVGECLARGWRTVVPYITLVIVFGLTYAGSVRAVTNADDGQRYDTLLAACLLLTLLLMRACGAWVAQDESADATQPGGRLPLRGLAVGAVIAVVIGLVVAAVAQSSALVGPARTAARQPPIDRSAPLTPLSFTSGIRPADPRSAGRPVFVMTTDRPGSNYVSIADVDYYDGDGWSFDRTFRPSGGVVPADEDPDLRPTDASTMQQYTVVAGPLTGTPWMPYLYRPRRVSGAAVDVDVASGMVVPAQRLRPGTTYSVQSTVDDASFDRLRSSDSPAGYTSQNLQMPSGEVRSALSDLVQALAAETGTPPSSSLAFVQAVARDFRTNFGLAGGPAPKPTPSASSSATPRSPTPAVLTTPSDAQRAGGTSFADVLASIRQFRSATPEQYATLMCLVARQVGVPARVATGFRVPLPKGDSALPSGRYRITTAQAWTWVEVPVAGHGWLVVDASPRTYSGQRPPAERGSTPSATPSVSPSTAAITTADSGAPPAPPSERPRARSTDSSVALPVVIIVVTAIVLVVLAFFLLRKHRRAARRRRGSPRAQLLGAWRETLDRLEEYGLTTLRSATGREIAEATADSFGAEPARAVRQLGDAANAAIFRPSTAVTQEDADAAWQAESVLVSMVRRQLAWRQRLRATLRYRRAGSDRPAAGPDSWSEVHGHPVADPLRRRGVHR